LSSMRHLIISLMNVRVVHARGPKLPPTGLVLAVYDVCPGLSQVESSRASNEMIISGPVLPCLVQFTRQREFERRCLCMLPSRLCTFLHHLMCYMLVANDAVEMNLQLRRLVLLACGVFYSSS
jgi:hypothetical protein